MANKKLKMGILGITLVFAVTSVTLVLAGCSKNPEKLQTQLNKLREQAVELDESGDTDKAAKIEEEIAKLSGELEGAQNAAIENANKKASSKVERTLNAKEFIMKKFCIALLFAAFAVGGVFAAGPMLPTIPTAAKSKCSASCPAWSSPPRSAHYPLPRLHPHLRPQVPGVH
jgi:hypothetical protein